MKDLSNRLAALRKISSAGKNPQNTDKRNDDLSEITMPEGWVQTGKYIFERNLTYDGFSSFNLHPYFIKQKIPSDGLVFFDLETTGLSGGAGTYIFLAGFGSLQNGTFSIRQIFMSDFPGEDEFTEACCNIPDNDTTLVSFNGKSFDYPLLYSKACFFRKKLEIKNHIDLLHPSRRLWKESLENCSLSSIEAEILEIRRENNIPGIMIPDRYFSFLKSRDLRLLDEVFSHHLQDIISLFLLLKKINTILNTRPESRYSLRELGRMLLETEPEKSEEIFCGLLSGQDALAGKYLALLYKKNRNIDAEHRTWEICWNLEKDYFNSVEYAKCLEHKIKDYEKALEVLACLQESTQLTGSRKTAADYRICRIRNKLSKNN